MEAASLDDLKRASAQGSLLRIKVNGRVYGSGGFTSPPSYSSLTLTAILVGIGMLFGGVVFFVVRRRFLRKKVMDLPPSFRESLRIECQDVVKNKSANNGVGVLLLFESVRLRFLHPNLPAPTNLQMERQSVDGMHTDNQDQEEQPASGALALFASMCDRFRQRQLSQDSSISVELSPTVHENESEMDNKKDEARPLD